MKRTLTVGQLIERLESLPQDAEIMIVGTGTFEDSYVTKVTYDDEYGAVIIE